MQVIVNEETAAETKKYITQKLDAIKAQQGAGDLEELALIIGNFTSRAGWPASLTPQADGKSLTYALEKAISPQFLELAMMCKAVICCEPDTARLQSLR